MNRIAAALAALMLPAALAAAPIAAQSVRPDVTLPFERANLNIYVPVSVAGSKPVWFLLDTGAKPAIVDLGLARRLGLAMGDSVAVGGGGAHPVRGYLLKDSPFSLVGLADFQQPLLLAMPLDDLSRASGRDISGIIGYDFIRQFVVEIDYTRQTITLRDTTAWIYRGKGESFPITFNAAYHPVVHARLVDRGGPPVEGKFVFDLGSGATVILNRPFIEEHHLLAADRTTVPWLEGRGIGGTIAGRVGRMRAVELGRFRIMDPVIVFAQAETGPFAATDVEGNLGAAILDRFKVILDYARQRILLEPTPRLGEPLDYNRSGLMFSSGGDDLRTYTITGVADRSPAAEAGLAPGDTLVAIDGHSAAERTLSDIRLGFRHGKICRLTVRRGDRRIETRFALRSPI